MASESSKRKAKSIQPAPRPPLSPAEHRRMVVSMHPGQKECEYQGMMLGIPGRVYFADADDGQGVKVGYSERPAQRVAGFVRGQRLNRPGIRTLRLLGCAAGRVADERRVHSWLAPWRIHGFRELYRAHPEVLRIVGRLMEMGRVPETLEELSQ